MLRRAQGNHIPPFFLLVDYFLWLKEKFADIPPQLT